MQRRTHDGGITTTDDIVTHESGCSSVSHLGMTCDEARLAWARGKLPRTTGRTFQPVIFRKATSGTGTS